MLSGLQETYDPRHRLRIETELQGTGVTPETIQVPLTRLQTLLDRYGLRRIHYLSIDTEGAEPQVLRSIDFSKVFIDVIGFEANYPEDGVALLAFLAEKGYRRLPIQNSSDIFVIHKDSQFRP